MEKATRSTNQEKIKGQLLEAFHSRNMEKLMFLARDLPERAKYDLPVLVARWNESKRVLSPLDASIIDGHYHICKLLIEDGASLAKPFKEQYHPLSLALLQNQTKIAELIIDSGADVTKTEFDGSYPIFWAIKNKHPPNIIGKILSSGFPANSIALELLKLRPIHIAVMEDHFEAVKILIKYSIDPNVTTSEGETPLLIAARHNYSFEMVKVLVKHGADLNNVNDAMSPLLGAIEKKNIKMVETLLDLGASIESGCVNKIPISPLLFTVNFAINDDMIELLLSRGANVNAKNQISGESALHALVGNEEFDNPALRKAQIKIAKTLLNYKADIDAVDKDGATPLYLAIERQNREMCTFLLKQGAKLSDVKCIIGNDGLPLVAFECIVGIEDLATPELIKICLEQGSDYNYRNKFGLTMYHCAEKYNNEEMIKYFLQHGCPSDQEKHMPGKLTSVFWQRQNDKVTRLLSVQSKFILGVKKGNLGLVLKAVDNGAEPKGCSMEIPSTLHYVSSKGHHDLARLLLEKGVPVNRLNSEGVTALYLAVQGGHLKTCEVLLEFGACYCHRGSVDNKGIELLVKSHHGISKVFKKISKCFKLTKLGDSSVLKVVLDCGEVMLPVLMNCVNKQGLTLTGLSLRLGHSGLATDLMALRVEHLTAKD